MEEQGMTTAERPRVGRRCAACRRDMLNSDGCVERPGCITPLQEWDMLAALPSWADCLPPKPVEPCRDCGTPPGGFHHLLCCKAFCSLHNNQRLQCGCDRRP